MFQKLIAGAALLLAQDAFAALERSIDGKGDAIYLPYYTVEAGQTTRVTVVNHSDRATAAYVRFSEALNGHNVTSINIYLPPRAQWSGTVDALGAEGARLSPMPGVCTVPIARIDGGFPFVPWDYADNFPDGGATSTARARTGAIEVLEFGSLTGAMAAEASAFDCEALEMRHTQVDDDPPPSRLPLLGMPTRQISAHVQIVDAMRGMAYTIDGIAISGFFGKPVDIDPGDTNYTLAAPVNAGTESRIYVNRPDGQYWVRTHRAPDAVSALFMTPTLEGDFVVDPSLGAQSAWIVSFPTRHAYVADRPGSLVPPNGESVAPFAADFLPVGACEAMETTRASALGAAVPAIIPFTLPPAEGDAFCGQVNLRFLAAAEPPLQGNDRIDLGGAGRELRLRRVSDGSEVVLRGLPAVGVGVTRIISDPEGAARNMSFAVPLRSGTVALRPRN